MSTSNYTYQQINRLVGNGKLSLCFSKAPRGAFSKVPSPIFFTNPLEVSTMARYLKIFLVVWSAFALAETEISATTKHLGQSAPKIRIGPKQPWKPMPASSPRTKSCEVKAGGRDDSAAIMSAIKECNGGGRVIFSRGKTYNIGTALDLRNLRNIDLVIQGKIEFSRDTSYWQRSAFRYKFQNAACYWALGGTDVNVYGGGSLNGNGNAWSSVFSANKNAIRPILFCIDGLNGGTVSDLSMNNSPQWVNLIMNSRNVIYSEIKIDSKHKNGDGWDTVKPFAFVSSRLTVRSTGVITLLFKIA
jgi:polygalacturonase